MRVNRGAPDPVEDALRAQTHILQRLRVLGLELIDTRNRAAGLRQILRGPQVLIFLLLRRPAILSEA